MLSHRLGRETWFDDTISRSPDGMAVIGLRRTGTGQGGRVCSSRMVLTTHDRSSQKWFTRRKAAHFGQSSSDYGGLRMFRYTLKAK